ncbi:hypothetical protein [Caballeronia sp. AZ10_KS36]|uniref:hypothetical protein n=1 Tax=Caballeronia sp. AZ10_KS36 TaxID=2921757 RepID=UPI0020283D6D|nr:hypothetical protein [Caballeronia sp. AZ10_KS36]
MNTLTKENPHIYTLDELNLMGGANNLFWAAEQIGRNAENYFLPRGEWKTEEVRAALAAEGLPEDLITFGALIFAYATLRVQGEMSQAAFIHVFCRDSTLEDEIVERSYIGAKLIESHALYREAYTRAFEAYSRLPFYVVGERLLFDTDEERKRTRDPEYVRSLWEFRGKLTVLIEESRAKALAAKK